MLNRNWIGHRLPTVEFLVERSRLRFFAAAIGETNPIYTDLQAARAAGYHDLPAPPTFLFTAEVEGDLKTNWLAEAGVSMMQVLHGEQSFTYHRPLCAGDTVHVTSQIEDIYDKKNGALEFVVIKTEAVDPQGVVVAESRGVVVVRH